MWQDCWSASPSYAERAIILGVKHGRGWQNGLADAGSRGNFQMAAGPEFTPSKVHLGPDKLAFLEDMLESTHERRSEQPQAIMAASTGLLVPAAILARGASCNCLGDNPVFAGIPPTPGRRQAGHTAPPLQEEARQGPTLSRTGPTTGSQPSHSPARPARTHACPGQAIRRRTREEASLHRGGRGSSSPGSFGSQRQRKPLRGQAALRLTAAALGGLGAAMGNPTGGNHASNRLVGVRTLPGRYTSWSRQLEPHGTQAFWRGQPAQMRLLSRG